MPSFGKKSKKNLDTCDPRLQKIANEVIKSVDFSVIQGHRVCWQQRKAYSEGSSMVDWPDSKHNLIPSKAFDAIPYPTGWYNIGQFYYLAGAIIAAATFLNYKIRWGGDWNGNGNFEDQEFNDLAHFELVED